MSGTPRSDLPESPPRRVLVHVTTVPMSLMFLAGQPAFLRERGYEVHVVSAPGDELPRFAAEQGATPHALGLARRIAPFRDAVAILALARLLRRLGAGIVHGHTPKGGMVAAVAGSLAGVPARLYHLRGLAWRPGSAPRGARLVRAAERVTCRLSHRVFAVSAALRATAIAEGLCPASKIRVLAGGSGNGVDAAGRFDPARHAGAGAATRARLGIAPQAPVIGFVGRLARDKGVVELAAAWRVLAASFPEAHLLLVGPPDARDPVAPEILAELERDPRVRMTGFERDTAPLYAAMDVVALPTRREGFPNVPLEAAAMERPVVASRIPGCEEAVADGTTGTLVAPGDPEALAAALGAYLRDPELARRHGRAGRERVLLEFRPRAIWEALHEEYERLAAAPGGTRRWSDSLARARDVLGALAGLVVLAPLMAVIAAVIAAAMGRPVLFVQERAGRRGRTFRMVKFRTMREAWDASGAPLPDGERLTPLGRFLRRTSLDELPQLWNILRGEMSLVGPRPLLVEYLPRYTPEQSRRHEVRPGLTGLTQVSGRNALSWDERFALDVWYVDHRSPWLDVTILARTLGNVVRGRGIAQAGRDTTEPFRGKSPS